MKIHEFQAKELLASYHVEVPRSKIAATPDDAAQAFRDLGGNLNVVKAQIHAGGRGKGGGVKLVRSAEEARNAAAAMLGRPLITHQTSPKGQIVRKVLVEAGTKIEREIYVGVVVDRSARRPVLMACAEGGVEIEEIAARSPERILKEPVDPLTGLHGYQARRLAFALGLAKDTLKSATALFQNLCRLFLEKDCSIAEINPLVITEDHRVVALDAKMNFDANGLFRQKDVVEYRDVFEEDAREAEAAAHGLSWVSLEGDIGCMVNGAGLAMATLDSILLCGGRPANFLDVGGGVKTDQVREAFKLILKDDKVRAILVNIFGGIAKCDVVADGILQAARQVDIHVPLVVRLEGTNVEIGRRLLKDGGLDLVSAATMGEAAQKVVEMARKGGGR